MTGGLRLLLLGGIALAAPLFLLTNMGGGRPQGVVGNAPAQQATGAQQQVQRFYQEAERRNQFINGFQQLQGVAMWIEHYHFQEYELPTSVDQIRHGLPEILPDGPDRFSFDPYDASVSMHFEARLDIADGAVTFTPTADENNERLSWECWTSDYPEMKSLVPTCTYFAPSQ